MDDSFAAPVCIAAPQWFWFVLLLWFSFSLPAVPSLRCTGRTHHIWGLNRDPDTAHARREQERRLQRHVEQEGNKRRALDELKNDTRTKSSKPATRCSRILSGHAKNVTKDGTDLNWVNEENFDTSDDEMRRQERGRPRLRVRRGQKLLLSGRPPFRQSGSLSKSSRAWTRSPSHRFTPPPSYTAS